MNYFIDTSSLVKIYHNELGTSDILSIYYNSENLIQISELGRVEFLSTIHRKLRENEISWETLNALIDKFEDDSFFRFEILPFSSLIADEAELLIKQIANQYSLRTLDSLQFAFFKIYCENDTLFVCSDTRLYNIVNREGYQSLLI